jgi:REP element-mobilizing transposase RayT
MARRPRIVVEGGLYHVYNRISSGEPVFADPNEAMEFKEIIRDVKKRDGWTVFAWSVLSNHFHLVVRTSSVPLWRGMHGIQNRFSRGFNRRLGRTGSLWQGRYKAKYVEDQSYLGRLVLYVHLNPVKAGLVEDPVEYPFAGHREVKKQLRSPLVDVDEMLLCFGETSKAARHSYLRAIRIGVDPDAPDVESIWHPFDDKKDTPFQVNADARHVDVLGRSTDLERPTLEADEFIKQVCELAGLDFEYLVSRARDRDTAGARRLVVTLGVERWRQKGTALALVLNKNPDVVSWWVGEGIRRRLEDEEFATKLDKLDKELSASLTQSHQSGK